MSSTSAFISLGLVQGSWAAGVTGWFFWFTRRHRKARNPIVIGLVYIAIVVSALESLAL